MLSKILAGVTALTLISCGQVKSTSKVATEASDSNMADLPFWKVNKAGDGSLSRNHSLYRYFAAAQAKRLPTNYFRDMIASNSRITLRYADWPRYQPGRGSSGTIYHPKVGKSFSEWKGLDWSSFYNELFHAWWGTVFTKSRKYAADRSALLTSERRSHYRKAHPRNPLLAQEEAYSETIASLTLYYYPKYNPFSESKVGYFVLDFFEYNTGKTVSAVGHSDRPGFTKAAESTFPNRAEYAVIFRQLTDFEPPQ